MRPLPAIVICAALGGCVGAFPASSLDDAGAAATADGGATSGGFDPTGGADSSPGPPARGTDASTPGRPGPAVDVGPPPPAGADAAVVPPPDEADAAIDPRTPDAGCQPVLELCNTVDDDCDGNVDEGLGLGVPCVEGLGPCERAGFRVCGAAGEVVCNAVPGPASFETCDGADEDCDGQIDEGLGLGQPCDRGEGRCRQPGQVVCRADGAVMCDAPDPNGDFDADGVACPDDCDDTAPTVGPGFGEVCDGLDNDCNGAVDEHPDCDCETVFRGPRPYLFCPTTRRYDGAASRCERYGTGLVAIDTAAESDWIKAELRRRGRDDWWIGLTDRGDENVWRWSDGREAEFRDFARRQPDDYLGEDCVEMWAAKGFRWNDNDCGSFERGICEPLCIAGTDADGDGFTGCGQDCDDTDPAIGEACP